jgi:hypothetical protein
MARERCPKLKGIWLNNKIPFPGNSVKQAGMLGVNKQAPGWLGLEKEYDKSE